MHACLFVNKCTCCAQHSCRYLSVNVIVQKSRAWPRGVAQVVERVLSMDEAAGSMPATSINLLFPSAPPIKKKGTYFKRVCVCGEGGGGQGAGAGGPHRQREEAHARARSASEHVQLLAIDRLRQWLPEAQKRGLAAQDASKSLRPCLSYAVRQPLASRYVRTA